MFQWCIPVILSISVIFFKFTNFQKSKIVNRPTSRETNNKFTPFTYIQIHFISVVVKEKLLIFCGTLRVSFH